MNVPEDIIIHPRKAGRELAIPTNGYLLVTPTEFRCARELVRQNGGREQFVYGASLWVAADNSYFIAGPAIGAPVAAMVLEKLIALGARRIIMYGWCGAIVKTLQVGDVVIGGRPVSGEGTSRYYPTLSVPHPAKSLTDGLMRTLADAAIPAAQYAVWSTDAPYREDRNQLALLHENDDVCCVDMEYSALCAVAGFRHVEFAGLFLVSDELYQERWTPGYVREDFRKKSGQLVTLLLTGQIFGDMV